MSFKLYLKRGIKFILTGYKQPIVKVNVVQKTPNEVFKNKIFVVTGGGSGLGFAISSKLATEGAKVIITGRNEDKLKSACTELSKNTNADYIVLDIRNIETFDTFFEKIYKKYGKIDGIVNNAGISLHEGDFMKVDKNKFESQFQTNIMGSYFFTQSYIKYYKKNNQQEGKILFISSERGTYCDDLPYGLTKAAMNSLVQALSYQYYRDNININALSPGVTASDMTGINRNDDLYSESNSQRYFVPEEVGEIAAFLLSDFSKCISGQIIHTNGGNHIRRGYK